MQIVSRSQLMRVRTSLVLASDAERTSLQTPDELRALQDQSLSTLSNYESLPSSGSVYWNLLDALRTHPWLRATITAIGRSVVGMEWQLKKEEGKATAAQKRDLQDFFSSVPEREFNNLKDLQGSKSKMYLTAGCLRTFGIGAWEVLRNSLGKAIGYDYAWGIVVPNVDKKGNFKTPAWRLYTERENLLRPIEYPNPDDLVVFPNPDFGGLFYSSDMEATASFSLPSDIWAMASYLSMHKDRSAPYDGVWVVPAEIDDDSFKKVQALIYARYRGSRNFARTPIVARGDLDFKPTRRGEDDAPYKEGRSMSRQEIAGVAGISGAQVGVTEETTRSNLTQVRKQTHETTILPTIRLIEENIHLQVSIREFQAPGWWLRFDPPDFLTVIEKSGVAQRMRQLGAISSNEMRGMVWNMPPRKGGEDDFLYPTNYIAATGQGGPPQNPDLQEPRGDGDGDTDAGNPRTDDPDQYRDSRMKEAEREAMVEELRKWRSFSTRTLKGKRPVREFQTRFVPADVKDYIQEQVTRFPNVEFVASLFDAAITAAEGLS